MSKSFYIILFYCELKKYSNPVLRARACVCVCDTRDIHLL